MSKKSVIVRLHKNKQQFEILVNHGTIDQFRQSKLDWDKVPCSDDIFKSVSTGEKYTNNELQFCFGTSNVSECMQYVALHGELQLTTQDRKDMTLSKYKQIVNYIHKYYINPKTKQTYPVTHIEAALQQVKFKTDFNEPVEKQVDRAIKMLIGVLVCRKCVMEGTLIIPTEHIGPAYNTINGLCDILKEHCSSSNVNNYEFYISVIPGNYDILTNSLQNICKGNFDFIINDPSVPPPTTTTTKKNKK